MKGHLRRAHADENQRVSEYWEKGCPALRIPISGAGRFKADILAFIDKGVRLELVRRAEPLKCWKCKGIGKIHLISCNICKGKGRINQNDITFVKSEIYDAERLSRQISHNIQRDVQIFLVAHFPSFKTWRTQHLMNWDGKDVVIGV